MITATRNDFLTARAWHRAVVGGKDMILRCTSALEHLGLFGGYMREKMIEVYARQQGPFDNISYCIVDAFDGLDYVRYGDVLCTTISQTFNDMLEDFDNTDEQALLEGLSNYYYSNGESFDGLNIKPENMELFDSRKGWAIEYYNEV